MRQVPYHRCTCLMRTRGQGVHIVHASCAVINLGQHHNGDCVVDRVCDVFRCYSFKRITLPQQRNQPFYHVKITGKVASVRQDHFASWHQFDGRGHRLIHFDRQSIPHNHRPLGRTDQPPDHIPHAAGLLHPAGSVPAFDEQFAPFVMQNTGQPFSSAARQWAQRIAIEVDQSIRQIKRLFSKYRFHCASFKIRFCCVLMVIQEQIKKRKRIHDRC